VPFAAGGPSDVAGRVIAQRLSEVLGQQVVVENTVGAGETLQEIARSYNVSHPTIMRRFPSPFGQSEGASLAG
jgi:tripartite-type tricarboxylate transporter receptor subunit TctC